MAGATGFVGRALLEALRADYEVVGLTRSSALPGGTPEGQRGVRWKTADLFSLLDVERALEGADAAFYLVHSMLPSAELTQGSFADFDLILADNFARAARARGVRHVVYLGGLIPEERPLSAHLRSRLEVEEAFRAREVPFTAVRASVVIGREGSSFRIVERLVRRLPVMLLPRWTHTLTQPVALEDLVALLRWCLEHPEETAGRVADVGGPDVVPYRALLEETARALGLRRRALALPLFSPGLSKLWVRLVTGVPGQLVSPLVDSLRHTMRVRDGWLQQRAGMPGRTLAQAVREAVGPPPGAARAAGSSSGAALPRPAVLPAVLPAPWRRPRRDVRSVQRLPLPAGWSAEDVAAEYARWLPRFCRPFLDVTVSAEGVYRFRVALLRLPLLQLSHAPLRSTPDRQLLYITGGVLARVLPRGRARFEFREVLGRSCVLAGIHEFTPRLPWALYKGSQALVHLVVMRGFGRHLGRLGRALPPPTASAAALLAAGAEVGAEVGAGLEARAEGAAAQVSRST